MNKLINAKKNKGKRKRSTIRLARDLGVGSKKSNKPKEEQEEEKPVKMDVTTPADERADRLRLKEINTKDEQRFLSAQAKLRQQKKELGEKISKYINKGDKESAIGADYGGITYSKNLYNKLGRIGVSARKSLTDPGKYANINTELSTRRGGTFSGRFDTDKNIDLSYESPSGSSISFSKAAEGALSGTYTSPAGRSFTLSKDREQGISGSYTSPKGMTISGHYLKSGEEGVPVYGASISGNRGGLEYSSDGSVSGNITTRYGLASAKYDIKNKRGEISATIPIRGKKRKK